MDDIPNNHQINSSDSEDEQAYNLEDEDTMYDEQADEKNAEWVKKQHPGATDAVLACPLCFTQVCFVCQQHTKYSGQYRAASVEHCRICDDQLYTFNKRGLMVPLASEKDIPNQNVYRLVLCRKCNTKIGVLDSDGFYHLFHVLTNS
ncbi:hypothetical protein COEREDRAFT_44555 [Coemansia reversa NRRL 1564]|uniref:E2F-associated phosphoprotein n=1 Tax=Coemansia reversa (strain ATCC 12441 / NRRL 1564) TaxID=763665 RepID=A0A2G5B9Z0_COERN|nr:hypothetical protein COEREDRAFT_44555 [Coemansia reversa NRRL 1564]|eukprot:PIA15547.1 hypothetical protein COEREDRAFT_44555 [Coemansia reversa NRRL 1564]